MDRIPVDAGDAMEALLSQIAGLSRELAVAKAQLKALTRLIPADVLAAANGGECDDDETKSAA